MKQNQLTELLRSVLLVSIHSVTSGIERAVVKEFLQKRKWIDEGELTELFSSTSIVPGVRALKIIGDIGYRRGGAVGSMASVFFFCLPAVLLSVLFFMLSTSGDTISFVMTVGAVIGLGLLSVHTNTMRIKLLKTAGDYLIFILFFAIAMFGLDFFVIVIAGGLLSLGNHIYQRAKPVEFHDPYEDERIEEKMNVERELSGVPLYSLILWGAILLSATILWFISGSLLSRTVLFALLAGSLLVTDTYLTFAFLFSFYFLDLQVVSQMLLLQVLGFSLLSGVPSLTMVVTSSYYVGEDLLMTLLTVSLFLVPTLLSHVASTPVRIRLKRSRLYSEFLNGVMVAALALLFATTFVFALDFPWRPEYLGVFIATVLLGHIRSK